MKSTAKTFKKLFEKARQRIEYFVQGAILEFTESVVSRMNELGVSNSVLAVRLKCKPPYVTKVLRGGTNFTLESMVKIALALDSELTPVKLIPRVPIQKWTGRSGFVNRSPTGQIKKETLSNDPEISLAA